MHLHVRVVLRQYVRVCICVRVYVRVIFLFRKGTRRIVFFSRTQEHSAACDCINLGRACHGNRICMDDWALGGALGTRS